MTLHGKNFIGDRKSANGDKLIYGFDPKAGKRLDSGFYEATADEVDQALTLAHGASDVLRAAPAEQISRLLENIATEIEALGDDLIEQAATESGLGRDRLLGERARTVGQLRMFARLVGDGAYLDARIDTALPDRKPLPRPDLRRMLIPIGPVTVFGASNFPLAFSVAGGDTASALAARNPVIVKAHPAHPGTSELVAEAISRAVAKTALPPGTFSMVHAADPEVSLSLVKHPLTKAVGFTGSERAGRAIYNAACARPEPIPAYVEMGSNNPVFLLPGALETMTDTVAQGLFNSVNLGVGQMCTSPGVVIGARGERWDAFAAKLKPLFEGGAAATMLHPAILKGYNEAVEKRAQSVTAVRSTATSDAARTEALPVLFETDSSAWFADQELAAEVFGPSTVLVKAQSKSELVKIAREWSGTLTATVFGTPEDLVDNAELISVLQTKAGRIIFNGFPTGVEVGHAMHHGGPYPATADAKFTSVGTAAILRFLRPVCFQNFPDAALPVELQSSNPRGILRLVNGELTREPVA